MVFSLQYLCFTMRVVMVVSEQLVDLGTQLQSKYYLGGRGKKTVP